jgi:hypothetical protein
MKRAWKILGVVVAAIALAFGSLVLYVRTAESRRWNEMGKLVEELAQEAGRREGSRPVLRGDPVPGDAWEEYGPVLKEYDDALQAAVAGTSSVRPEWPGDAVAALRRGVRRASALNPYAEDWARGEGRYPMDAMNVMSKYALRQARWALEEGRLREAAEIALDVSLFARDLGFNGNFGLQEGSRQIQHDAFEELRRVVLACGTDRETVREIAAELEILDRALSRSGYVVLNELARDGRELHRSETWEWWGRDIDRASWRQAFSRKIMAADGYARIVHWIRRHLDGDDLPWGANNGTRDEFLWTQTVDSDNALLEAASHLENLWSSESRETHARLHLLILSARYLATGDVAAIPDPFGTTLPTLLEGGKLRAWSIGRLRDNVGVGGFQELTIEVTR